MNKGQAFSLVKWDIDHLWAVGRVVDSPSVEQAFHHLKFELKDGTIWSVNYK